MVRYEPPDREELARMRLRNPEWLARMPAEVFACLLPGELRIIVFPGVGLAGGGAPWNVPVDVVPPDLRMPNTLLWLQVDEYLNVIRVWRRDPAPDEDRAG